MEVDIEKLVAEIRRDNPIPPHIAKRLARGISIPRRAYRRPSQAQSESPRDRLYSLIKEEGPLPDQSKDFYKGLGRCWEWLGNLAPNGYPLFSLTTPTESHSRGHRASWEIHFGPIPAGKWVLHRCDNRSCINPEHLFLGDSRTNAVDCAVKGRRPKFHPPKDFFKKNPHLVIRGEQRKSAKLTVEKVKLIRVRYAKGGIFMEDLAAEFGVHPGTIRNAIRGIQWAHVD